MDDEQRIARRWFRAVFANDPAALRVRSLVGGWLEQHVPDATAWAVILLHAEVYHALKDAADPGIWLRENPAEEARALGAAASEGAAL